MSVEGRYGVDRALGIGLPQPIGGGGGKPGPERPVSQDASAAIRQCPVVAGRHQQGLDPVTDLLRDTADSGGDNRNASGDPSSRTSGVPSLSRTYPRIRK
jgi:hypothetical protein